MADDLKGGLANGLKATILIFLKSFTLDQRVSFLTIPYTSGSQPFLVSGTLDVRKNLAAHQKIFTTTYLMHTGLSAFLYFATKISESNK